MDLFGVIPFVHDIDVGMSDSMTLLQEIFWRAGYRGPDAERS